MSELDQAEMRLEFRRLYKEIGFTACMQVLLEITTSAGIPADIMLEEQSIEYKPTDMDHG